MKKIFFLAMFVAIATIATAQVAFTEISYDSLDVASKKLFSQYGVANPYGEIVKVETDSIISIFEISDIPRSRKMIADSTGTKPEFQTQYMIVYIKDGATGAFVSLDDPSSNGNDAVNISTLLSGTGLRQGDDEFPDAPVEESNQKDYLLNNEW